MARMFNFFEVVATLALVGIHMDVRRATALLTEQNRFARPRDGRNFHPMGITPLLNGFVIARAQVDFEIIIKTVYQVAAFRIDVICEQTNDAEMIARARDDLPVHVIRLQFVWPGIRWNPPGRKFLVVVVGVHYRRQVKLAHIV